uniref:Secreted protein n=1 Tax=Streptomyces sp. NBC_00049 TaxID=2903617 RepID=A0AAU2K2C0_9ACTN
MTFLYLDVDGPLIPFGAGPYPAYAQGPETGNPLLSRIDPGLGPRLTGLRCDLVWATTWGEEANECVAPRLGLPALPVMTWPDPSEQGDQDERGARRGIHWKTPGLLRHAAGRPFVWVDDEITAADRAWVAAHHPGPALLHRVDPGRGLADADFAALHAWLSSERPPRTRRPVSAPPH